MNEIFDLFFTFSKIGAFTFGGGYAMISLLDHECVERKKWLTSEELLDITVIAESTPGPIAINCATYTGYRVAGMKGAISATVGIVLPSFLLLWIISSFFETCLAVNRISGMFRGIRIAVAVLIIQTAWRMIGKMAKQSPRRTAQLPIMVFFFLLVLIFNLAEIHVSTVYYIVFSGLAGYLLFGSAGNHRERRKDG